jgi:hypothetical protein
MVYAGPISTLFLGFSAESAGMWVPDLAFRRTDAEAYTSAISLLAPVLPKSAHGRAGELGIPSFTVTSTGTLYLIASLFHKPSDHRTTVDVLALAKSWSPFEAFEIWSREEIEHHNCFPVELLGADDAGPFAKTGFEIRTPGVAGFKVEYAVSQFLWGTRQVKKLANLPNIFF